LYGCKNFSIVKGSPTHTKGVTELGVEEYIWALDGERVTEDWRKLQNEKVRDLNSSPDII
jgi:hypothetical protein